MDLHQQYSSSNGSRNGHRTPRRSSTRRRPSISRYIVALGITGLAAAAVALIDVTLSFPPFVLFAMAAGLSLLFAGRGPALLSVVLAAIASDFLFVQPRYELSMNRTTLGLATTYAVGALVSWSVVYWSQRRRHSG